MLQEFAQAAGQGARVATVRGRADAVWSSATMCSRTRDGGMTTADLVDCERRLIAAAAGRADERARSCPPAAIERAVAGADRPLTDRAGAGRPGVREQRARRRRRRGARGHRQDVHRRRAALGLRERRLPGDRSRADRPRGARARRRGRDRGVHDRPGADRHRAARRRLRRAHRGRARRGRHGADAPDRAAARARRARRARR